MFAGEQKANGFKDTKVSRHETIDGDHGRIETRTYTVFHDTAWLQKRHDWPGLQSVVMVESTRETGRATERETRFYITSLVLLAHQIGPVIRSHWAVENSLHWVMDMVFRDDECRVRKDHAPANFVTLIRSARRLCSSAIISLSITVIANLLRKESEGSGKHASVSRTADGDDKQNTYYFFEVKQRVEAGLGDLAGRHIVVPLPKVTYVFYGRDLSYLSG